MWYTQVKLSCHLHIMWLSQAIKHGCMGKGGVSGSKGKFKVGLILSFAFAHIQYSGHLFAYVILDGTY